MVLFISQYADFKHPWIAEKNQYSEVCLCLTAVLFVFYKVLLNLQFGLIRFRLAHWAKKIQFGRSLALIKQGDVLEGSEIARFMVNICFTLNWQSLNDIIFSSLNILSLVSLSTVIVRRVSQEWKKNDLIFSTWGHKLQECWWDNVMAFQLHFPTLLAVLMLCQDNRLKKDNFVSSYQSILTTLC